MVDIKYNEPYTTSSSFFSTSIIFDDIEILVINDKSLAKKIAASLNAAFNMGRYSMLVEEDNDKSKES